MGTELAVSAMLHQQQTLSQLRHTRCCTCTRKPAGIGTLVEVDYNMYSCCMCSAASCAPGSQLLWLPDACPARELASNTSITYAFTMLRIVLFTCQQAKVSCAAVPPYLVPLCLELLVLCLGVKQQGAQLLQVSYTAGGQAAASCTRWAAIQHSV